MILSNVVIIATGVALLFISSIMLGSKKGKPEYVMETDPLKYDWFMDNFPYPCNNCGFVNDSKLIDDPRTNSKNVYFTCNSCGETTDNVICNEVIQAAIII